MVGFPVLKKEEYSDVTFMWELEAKDIAKSAHPGQFVIIRYNEAGERIPLTIADFDRDKGTITLVVQAVGKSTQQMKSFPEGFIVPDVIGPLGNPSEIEDAKKVVIVGGGLGVAPIYPILRAYKQAGAYTITVVGFRNKDLMFWDDKLKEYSDELHVATDDGSYGTKGLVTEVLDKVIKDNGDLDLCVAIGPLVMMRAAAETTRPHNLKTIVSLNTIMVDGTGMCGSCRCTVDGKVQFACVDGPEFNAHLVDFDELMKRQNRFKREETKSTEEYAHHCKLFAEKKTIKTVKQEKTPISEQPPQVRVQNFNEVALGYSLSEALDEANRCLDCKKPTCIDGCPVHINIPKFIMEIRQRDFKASYETLKHDNMLPAVCGRVCPQEVQCEKTCVLSRRIEPVGIGRLERYVADIAMRNGWDVPMSVPMKKPIKAAIIGSGPGGLACAGDLCKAGLEVTVFEALHVPGGVLKYGIPEFRLPNYIIDREIRLLEDSGVRFELNSVIGKLFTIPELMEKHNYKIVYIGTGAGTPKFIGIEGEQLNGVLSANEFLTRVNLMTGFRFPYYDTPVGMGKIVAVIGAGNTAMDASRVALRMGADHVYLVYRRSLKESPARAEEIHHAQEEGVDFQFLTNPVRIIGDEQGWVKGMECVRMELGEPDDSGRRRPIPIEGSNFILDVDTVIPALGTSANPIIAQTTPGLKLNKWGYIEVDEESQMTSLPGVFAGGDIVTGAATVIEAMGAGRKAASGMLNYLGMAKKPATIP